MTAGIASGGVGDRKDDSAGEHDDQEGETERDDARTSEHDGTDARRGRVLATKSVSPSCQSPSEDRQRAPSFAYGREIAHRPPATSSSAAAQPSAAPGRRRSGSLPARSGRRCRRLRSAQRQQGVDAGLHDLDDGAPVELLQLEYLLDRPAREGNGDHLGSGRHHARRHARVPPDPATYFDAVKSELDSGANIVFGNLEGTLTTSSTSKCGSGGNPAEECYAFRDPPSFVQYLQGRRFHDPQRRQQPFRGLRTGRAGTDRADHPCRRTRPGRPPR